MLSSVDHVPNGPGLLTGKGRLQRSRTYTYACSKRSEYVENIPLQVRCHCGNVIGVSGRIWTIYKATALQDNTDVAVFVFDKQSLIGVKQKDKILEMIRHEARVLNELQSYSSHIIRLVLPAKENSQFIAFATEPVLGSLANLLGDCSSDLPPERVTFFNSFNFSELEVKYGIRQIAEALSYMHLVQGQIHCNVCPQNVIVCSSGAWKLFGFRFMQNANRPELLKIDLLPSKCTGDFLQPDVNYMAPCAFIGPPSCLSDVFALGMLMTAVYNCGCSLLEVTAISNFKNICHGKKELRKLWDERISCAFRSIVPKIPANIADALEKMISFEPVKRPSAQLLLMMSYYQDPRITALQFLDNIESHTEEQRQHFFSNALPSCISSIETKLLMRHLQPVVCKRLEDDNSNMSLLRAFMVMVERSSQDEYKVKLYPTVRMLIDKASSLSQESVIYLLEKHKLLLDKSDETMVSPRHLILRCFSKRDTALLAAPSLRQMVTLGEQQTFLVKHVIPLVSSYLRTPDSECFWPLSQMLTHELVGTMICLMEQCADPTLVSEGVLPALFMCMENNTALINFVTDALSSLLNGHHSERLTRNPIVEVLTRGLSALGALTSTPENQRIKVRQLIQRLQPIAEVIGEIKAPTRSTKPDEQPGANQPTKHLQPSRFCTALSMPSHGTGQPIASRPSIGAMMADIEKRELDSPSLLSQCLYVNTKPCKLVKSDSNLGPRYLSAETSLHLVSDGQQRRVDNYVRRRSLITETSLFHRQTCTTKHREITGVEIPVNNIHNTKGVGEGTLSNMSTSKAEPLQCSEMATNHTCQIALHRPENCNQEVSQSLMSSVLKHLDSATKVIKTWGKRHPNKLPFQHEVATSTHQTRDISQ